MKSIEDTLNELATLPLFRSERPATDAEIDRIQRDLGIVLPQEYVKFLKRFGYAHWFGHELFGLRPTNPETGQPMMTPDCVKVTKQEKDSDNPLGTAGLPPEHIVISTDGGGGNFLLFAQGSPYEGQVHWYNFEDGGEPIRVWESLCDYLDFEIQNAQNG